MNIRTTKQISSEGDELYFSFATATFAIFAKSVDFTGFFKGIKTRLCQIYATKI